MKTCEHVIFSNKNNETEWGDDDDDNDDVIVNLYFNGDDFNEK